MRSKFESFSYYPRQTNSSVNSMMRSDGEFHSDLEEIKSRIVNFEMKWHQKYDQSDQSPSQTSERSIRKASKTLQEIENEERLISVQERHLMRPPDPGSHPTDQLVIEQAKCAAVEKDIAMLRLRLESSEENASKAIVLRRSVQNLTEAIDRSEFLRRKQKAKISSMESDVKLLKQELKSRKESILTPQRSVRWVKRKRR